MVDLTYSLSHLNQSMDYVLQVGTKCVEDIQIIITSAQEADNVIPNQVCLLVSILVSSVTRLIETVS